MSNGEPNKPTPEECLKALNEMITAYGIVPIVNNAQENAFNQACKVANKLHRRKLWEDIHASL